MHDIIRRNLVPKVARRKALVVLPLLQADRILFLLQENFATDVENLGVRNMRRIAQSKLPSAMYVNRLDI